MTISPHNRAAELNVANAIEVLRRALNEDRGYWMTWQSNIAMQFQDELNRRGLSGTFFHEVSNKAADEFLKLLSKP